MLLWVNRSQQPCRHYYLHSTKKHERSLHAGVHNEDKDSSDPLIANSSFMEQENAKLNRLKKAVVNMRQDHLLWVIRFMLYRTAVTKNHHWLKRDAGRRLARAGGEALTEQTPPATSPQIVAQVLADNMDVIDI
jgi:hypothetical protein